MRLNKISISRWLLPVGFVLAALVIVRRHAGVAGRRSSTRSPALMFVAVFGARSAERRDRSER